MHWSYVLSREWKWSWSSADRWATILLHNKVRPILNVWRYIVKLLNLKFILDQCQCNMSGWVHRGHVASWIQILFLTVISCLWWLTLSFRCQNIWKFIAYIFEYEYASIIISVLMFYDWMICKHDMDISIMNGIGSFPDGFPAVCSCGSSSSVGS